MKFCGEAAAERATVLGAHETAALYWERARAVTADPADEADLLEKIGEANRNRRHFQAAETAFRGALDRYGALGDRVGTARASPGLGRALSDSEPTAEAVPLVEEAAAEIADVAPHPELAETWV